MIPYADALRIDQRRLHEGTGWTGLYTLATGDAGAGAHGVMLVEHDSGLVPAVRHADDVVDLYFPTGAHAQGAVNAGVQRDPHGRVAGIGQRCFAGGKAAVADAETVSPAPETGIDVMGKVASGLISQQ